MSKEFTWEDGDFEDKYDYSGTPLELLQHHGEVSPGFYNLTHGDKGYDANTPDNMRQATAMLRSITANEDARQLGRTSPTVEAAVGALGTSPKKPKGSNRLPKKKAAAKSKNKKPSASTKKGGKRKSRRKSRKKRRRRGGLGTPTCYGPGDCTGERAKRNQGMCLSFGYNPSTGRSDCQWGVPPASKPMPIMKPVAPVMAPVMAPIVCEDDRTFIRQGPHSTGRPLCEIIKSRKREIALEKDPEKRRKMVEMVIKNCSNLGAKHCPKTCGKCPKKKKALAPKPVKPTGTCKGRKSKFDKKCSSVLDKARCNYKKSCNWKGDKKGGRKYTKKKNFKKHYMWNTRGKRYFAKTYKQHRRGVKLGHTHKKPKKTRKRRR